MEQKATNSKTAFLIMDMQSNFTPHIKESPTLLKNISSTIEKARQAKIPIIYVVLGFRQGYPEASLNNKFFAAIKSSGFIDMQVKPEIPSEIAPQNGDIIVNKLRASAFVGSDLEVILKSLEVNHLVLCGIESSGVVLSTLREAADKDYKLTVLADCCADMEDEVHEFLIRKIFPKQAEVIQSSQWLA